MNTDQTSSHPQDNLKLAKTICLVISVITLITIILGLYLKNPFVIILGIIPPAIYEAIRTEGYFTKIASAGIALLVILEIFALRGLIKINLSSYFGGQEQVYFSGYNLPLGEITFVFPIIAVILSLILIWRTYGPYTKWLSILLLISSIILLYLVNKAGMSTIFQNINFFYYF